MKLRKWLARRHPEAYKYINEIEDYAEIEASEETLERCYNRNNLLYMFTWRLTPQGHYYWEGIRSEFLQVVSEEKARII